MDLARQFLCPIGKTSSRCRKQWVIFLSEVTKKKPPVPESLLKRQVGNTGGCNPLNKNAEKILLMVQKSGERQLRLVVYPDIYQGFIPFPQYFKHLLRPLYFAHGCVVEFGIPSMEGSFSHHIFTEVGEVNEGERKICVFPKIGGKPPKWMV